MGVKNKGLQRLIHRGWGFDDRITDKRWCSQGEQIIVVGRALGSWRVYLGGWGTYHGAVGTRVGYWDISKGLHYGISLLIH